MTDNRYTIGEFARLTGLTEKALRLYDGRGLLAPIEVDSTTGYRHYSASQVADGMLVAMLRAIDMPLAGIEEVLAASESERSALVRRYWYGIERQLDDQRDMVRQLHRHNEEREHGMSNTDAAVAAGRDEGAFAAIALLAGIEDPGEAAIAYGASMKAAYWTEKDLPLVTAIAYAGVDHLLAAAHRADSATAYAARSAAKGLMYDLASFTWVGWDEPGIEVSPSDASAGLAAAKTNLAMAIDLEKGDLAISRAHWMLGAHQLTAGRHQGAVSSFLAAEEFAARGSADVEVGLSRAFAALARLAAGDAGAAAELDAALDDLRSLEGGDEFAAQVDTARSVMGL
jgi:DNA-binding transcriptional MerR regulator